MRKITPIFTLLLLLSSPIHANDYVGIAITQPQLNVSGEVSGSSYNASFDMNGIESRYGRDFTKVFSGELRLGRTNEANDKIFGLNSDLQLDWYASAFGKAKFRNKSPITPYALAGYSYINSTLCISSICSSVDGGDPSYGIGFGTKGSKNWDFYFEWIRYSDGDAGELEGINIGIVQKY